MSATRLAGTAPTARSHLQLAAWKAEALWVIGFGVLGVALTGLLSTVFELRFQGARQVQNRTPGSASLDRRVRPIAPLGPRGVVQTHIRIAKQVGQHEPGVARACADRAVRHDLPFTSDASRRIRRAQVFR